jgi:hypothetical protein
VVGIATTEGIALGVLSSLQHKLLALVGSMLIANPTIGESERKVREGEREMERRWEGEREEVRDCVDIIIFPRLL